MCWSMGYVGGQVKWRLMVTSCYRRMGSFQKAMELYEAIHMKYPENLECTSLALFRGRGGGALWICDCFFHNVVHGCWCGCTWQVAILLCRCV